MNQEIYTLGLDIGSSLIKVVLMKYSDNPVILDKRTEKIRKRNPETVADLLIDQVLAEHQIKFEDIAYLASTGEGEMLERKKGHFLIYITIWIYFTNLWKNEMAKHSIYELTKNTES